MQQTAHPKSAFATRFSAFAVQKYESFNALATRPISERRAKRLAKSQRMADLKRHAGFVEAANTLYRCDNLDGRIAYIYDVYILDGCSSPITLSQERRKEILSHYKDNKFYKYDDNKQCDMFGKCVDEVIENMIRKYGREAWNS